MKCHHLHYLVNRVHTASNQLTMDQKEIDAMICRKGDICRTVMINTHQCLICGQIKSTPCYLLSLSRLNGWVYCTDCLNTGKLKQYVLAYIEKQKVVPCVWLFSTDKFQQSSYYCQEKNEGSYNLTRYLHFFRKSKKNSSKPVHTGIISPYSDDYVAILPAKDTLGISVTFRDTELGDSGETLGRVVSLENIFYHNPGFYECLKEQENLLSVDYVKVSYAELSEALRDEIHRAYIRAMAAKEAAVFDF